MIEFGHFPQVFLGVRCPVEVNAAVGVTLLDMKTNT